MATETTNGAPVTGEVQKEDNSNTATVDVGKPAALNEDAHKAVSAPQAGTATSPSVDKDADSSSKSAGDKHERDDAADKAAQAPKDEPANKKQKSDTEPFKGTNGTQANTATNGEKKRGPGRPKKSEGSTKTEKKTPKPRATEGIGSRTRSRVKA
ncbi:uncharacterized protein BDCG_00801 [Blastomyces dermatitidis ER-3]|uniref:Uncharacterized protein n=3 Tax=Blastomyces TaxID=229219 RepID=A0A179UTA2_BLAGS|nr:uncharacterized protein BDBG_06260 [Blastomyces gilchristii SLH14081]XP_045272072.1 uncharacterized protein BDCG_00801 [Blastomyces dermatitidis ER-3]EEQ83996.1 hypothetical protein BDCG_00801 [Blastomyces dermatitidis ER-3]EGE83380.1 hypothetical protein BDDG_06324 [Blastomyces dermatitidis ATCC 18188]OAT10418.1 hypothetical protein BDBG_06260 [Blastomyces gilchristii SLH14081]